MNDRSVAREPLLERAGGEHLRILRTDPGLGRGALETGEQLGVPS